MRNWKLHNADKLHNYKNGTRNNQGIIINESCTHDSKEANKIQLNERRRCRIHGDVHM